MVLCSALVGAVDANGQSIFKGRAATGFSNTEEIAIDKVNEIPFLLEDKIVSPGEPPPSAFQCRIGGSKGMLYVDPTLTGRVVRLRPSMIKFASDHRHIEVANFPRVSTLWLNRCVRARSAAPA